MRIRGYGKVVVPGTTDRSVRVTDGDGGGGVVTDDRIRRTDSDPWSRINPDYDIGINRSTGSRRSTVIIKDIWFKVIDDLMDNGITVDQGIGE